jgi:hypothetical protein
VTNAAVAPTSATSGSDPSAAAIVAAVKIASFSALVRATLFDRRRRNPP